jgi:hypothetical protein
VDGWRGEMMDKQTMLAELEEIRIYAMSKGQFPTDLNQFSRFCELLNAIIDRLPDEPVEDKEADGEVK